MTRRLPVRVAVAAAVVCSMISTLPSSANEATLDLTTTGAIAANSEPAETVGSVAFRDALKVLDDGGARAVFAAASALPDQTERRTLQWAAIYFGGGSISSEDVARFIEDAPDFADDAVFRTRIEQALVRANDPSPAVIEALGNEQPGSVDAQVLLAQSLLKAGERDKATELARQVWAENFLTTHQENEVRQTLGELLVREAHWQRAMHLMMHDRARGSERLLEFLTPAQQGLVAARAAVSRNDADAKAKLDAVDPSLHDNPVYIFSRAQRARQFELWESAAEWLEKAPADAPDAAEWWYERRTLVRQLLNIGEPRLAYEVASGYTAGPEARMVDAKFHAGWIALAFLGDAAAAKAQFAQMTTYATLPDTVAQSNYWLARANRKLDDAEAVRAALEAAARYGTVFYGQLARAELGETGAGIRPLPEWQTSQTLFDGNPVVKAIRLLVANGEVDRALPLLRHFSNELKTGGELVLASRLAAEIGAQNLAIAIAGRGEQLGAPLDTMNFPQAAVPKDAQLAADRAAVFAVVRQESMFQIDAVSSAGARGLMQLMPGTAREVAADVGVAYSPSRLVSDPAYNALLGSTYLADQLERYDGSLVLAAAAYNAGPGNANKWIRAYGDPRDANVDPVVWIELIPFQETRTYVKRVLGNYLVYREQFGDSRFTMHQALRTIE